MKYSFCKVGQKIREERERAGLSQDELVSQINVSRNTLSACENGKKMLQLGDMLKLCSIFDCELGYLLCEHDCKTRTRADVQEITGLSEKAISVLGAIKDSETSQSELQFINDLLSDRAAIYFISAAYEEYKQIQRYEKHIKPSPTGDEPFIVVNRGAMIDINESQAKSALALFTCQNRFLNFIQKEEV